MSTENLKIHMNNYFYINLGILIIKVYIKSEYYALAFSQTLESRYGQSIVCEIDSHTQNVNPHYIEWYITHHEDSWLITTSTNEIFTIKNLNRLGVHDNNSNYDISDSFEKVLFENYFGFHASMISDAKGQVIMISGKSGCGKTTLTQAFIASGYNYISDDLALIDSNLCCKYFRTSFHIRVSEENSTHKVNDEFRKFEFATTEPMLSTDLKLNSIIILDGFSKVGLEFFEVKNTYEKFSRISSMLVGLPSSKDFMSFATTLLKVPLYIVKMSKTDDILSTTDFIGDLIWGKNTKYLVHQ